MRVLICGGRDYDDQKFFNAVLDGMHLKHSFTHVIEGGAKGADSLAAAWAITRKVPHIVFPAEWDKHGKAAGTLRNIAMLEHGKPDMVIAFPGGVGTAHMIKITKEAGITLLDIASLFEGRKHGESKQP